MRFQLPARPDTSDFLIAALQEATAAVSVPPHATQKERARIFAACQASVRDKRDAAVSAWRIACDEVRVFARAEIEAIRSKAAAVRVAAAHQADAINAEAAAIEQELAAQTAAIEQELAFEAAALKQAIAT
jgi:hypothetical protein